MKFKQGPTIVVKVDFGNQSWIGAFEHFDHFGVLLGIVDQHPVEVGGKYVPQDLIYQGQFLMDDGGSPPLAGDFLNLFPLAQQKVRFIHQFFGGSTRSSRAHNQAHAFRTHLFGQVAQSNAFGFAVYTTRNSDIVGIGDEHQITPRQRDKGCYSGAFRANRLFDYLHQCFIVDSQDVANGQFAQSLGSFFAQVSGGVIGTQKGIAVGADVYKGCIHSRQNVGHAGLIDTADLPLFAGNQDFGKGTIFNDGRAPVAAVSHD